MADDANIEARSPFPNRRPVGTLAWRAFSLPHITQLRHARRCSSRRIFGVRSLARARQHQLATALDVQIRSRQRLEVDRQAALQRNDVLARQLRELREAIVNIERIHEPYDALRFEFAISHTLLKHHGGVEYFERAVERARAQLEDILAGAKYRTHT